MTVKDLFPQLVQNKGGKLKIRLNGKSPEWCCYCNKQYETSRVVDVRCIKTIKAKQQVHILVTPITVMKGVISSIGGGTEVVEYKSN